MAQREAIPTRRRAADLVAVAEVGVGAVDPAEGFEAGQRVGDGAGGAAVGAEVDERDMGVCRRREADGQQQGQGG
ncbi:MAG: hypothetical protein ACKN9T_16825 [Candidatus Methylumidiphilus sp.]